MRKIFNRKRGRMTFRPLSCIAESLEARQLLSTTIGSGQTIQGTIAAKGETDSYTFTATAGQTFIANVGDASSASAYLPDIHVYGPNSAPAGQGDGFYDGTGYAGSVNTSASAEVVVSSAAAGTYTIVVQDYVGNETGGTYDLELDAAPATQAPDANGDGGAITSGQTKAGTINHFGDLDVFTFTATAGQTFIANVGDASSASAYLPDIHVYGPNSAPAGQGDGFYDGTGYAGSVNTSASAEVVVSSAAAGTYTIVVQDYVGNETGGTYDLELDAAPATQAPDANGDGGAITSGQTKAGTINHFGDLDVFTFTATAGQTFIANVGDASSASAYLPDIHVYGPNSAPAGQGDGFYDGTGYAGSVNTSASAEVVVSSAAAGTYTIVVQDYVGNETGGTYDLELDAAPATQAPDANGDGGAITSGQTKAGTINHFGDLDVFTFTATAGQTFIANVGDASSASAYLPDIHVYGPNSAPAGQGDGFYDGTGYAGSVNTSASAEVVVSSAAAGTYTIVVQDYVGNETGGTYDLELDAAPATQAPDANGDGGAITSGQTKAGTINHFGDLDVFTFTATTGDVFDLTLADANAASDYHPEIRLYGPSGSPVGTGSGYYDGTGYAASPNTNTSVQVNGTIPTTGPYVAVVQDEAGAEVDGTYTLELTGSIHSVPQATIAVTAAAAQTATAAVAKTISLGSFTESNATAPYSVVVNWGDGTADTKFTLTTAGTITAQSHTYAKAGNDTVSVVITDAKSNVSNTATFGVTVAAVPTTNITVTAAPAQSATAAVGHTFTLGSFAESNATAPYSVVVNWGDGTADTKFTLTTAGTITAQSHTYAKAGNDTVTVVITDAKSNVSNTATFGVTVAAAPTTNITVTAGSAQSATAAVSHTFTLGSFAESNATSPYSVVVNWGDGTADTKFTLTTAGTITAQSHTYAKAGNDTVSVVITDAKSNVSNTATFGVTVAAAPTTNITVTPASAQSATAAVSHTFTLGSFAESNATSPYSVVVNWGDGTADTKFTLTTAGAITAQSHTYAKAGNDTVSVVINDAKSNVSNTATFGVTVAAAPTTNITTTAASAQSATAAVSHTFTLGSFAESNATSPYSVVVNWGDGTADTKFTLTTAGTITAQSHTYAKVGNDTVSVVITDAKSNVSNTATFGVTVAAAPTTNITVTAAAAQTATAAVAKTFSLGSFTESNATAPYGVEVNWGDGTADTKFTLTSAGTITAQSHTYAKAGNDTVSVTITDAKSNVSNTATFDVNVSAAPVTNIAVTAAAAQTATAAVAKTFSLGSFTESDATAPYSVDVNWGDGTANTKFKLMSAGTITVQSHTYAKAGNDTVSVVVTDAKSNVSNTATFGVTVAPVPMASIVVTAPPAQSSTATVVKSFTLGSFAETNATGPYAVDVNWGDGTADTIFTLNAAGNIPAQSHKYAAAGSKTVTVSVTDAHGNTSNKPTFAIAVAALTVGPVVVSSPVSLTLTAGQDAKFTASASGAPTPTVQWYVETAGASGFTPIDGATSGTLDLGSAILSESGNKYEAVFMNGAGSPATTAAATLTVAPASQPVTVTAGWGQAIYSHGTKADHYADSIPILMSFSIYLNGPSTQEVKVYVSTKDGRATAGKDYTAVGEWVVFMPGVTHMTVDVPILDGGMRNLKRAFFLELSDPENATLAAEPGYGGIGYNLGFIPGME